MAPRQLKFHERTLSTPLTRIRLQQSVVTLDRGTDYYRSTIEQVNPDGTVLCTLKPLVEYVSGNRQGWVASDDAITRF